MKSSYFLYIFCVLLLLCSSVQVVSAEGGYDYITQWGSLGSGLGDFNGPSGVAVDSAGNVYVVDESNGRVQKFDSSGTFIKKWGSKGSGNGQFFYPQGIAVDSAGNVYVADSGNDRIQKFTSDGMFIKKWGSSGSGNGQFSYPVGITVDSVGYVYVADTNNHRIQKFDSSGNFLMKWGYKGSGTGQFNLPTGVAVDSARNVYVADEGNNRIQKFTLSGTFVTEWGSPGSEEGQFKNPLSVAVDSAGNVYVVDHDNSRIQKFTSNGGFITKWGSSGSWNGLFSFPSGIAVDSTGNVYVADYGNNRILKFALHSVGYVYTTQWDVSGGTGTGMLSGLRGIAVDSAGNVYVADILNNRIQKFDSNGAFITKWGSYGSGNGQFDCPYGVAVDSAGNVYVADEWNNRIQKFTSDGTFITKWGSEGSGEGQFAGPQGVAVDSAGNVYVADTENNRIQKFTSNGVFITKWLVTSPDGWSTEPDGVAVDNVGNVYVVDVSYSDRVQKFTSSGAFIARFGSDYIHDSAMIWHTSVAVDNAGNVYLRSPGSGIKKFDLNGAFITEWGGYESGIYVGPDGNVAVDSAGNVYVTDVDSNWIQKFAPVTSPASLTPSFTATPTTGTAPLTVQFTDTTTGSPTSWYWNFGDGYASSAQNPSHLYSSAGTYTVTLTANNAAAGSKSVTKTGFITVSATLTPSFTATPTTGTAPLTVQFADTTTGSPTSWYWNFGDGYASGDQNPSHLYSAAGTYSVTLTATNAASGSKSTTKSGYITVTAAPAITPVADFTATPSTGAAPLAIQFTDRSTNANQWLWNFGDGSTLTTQNPSHTFQTAGTYTVQLQATNSGSGKTSTKSMTVTVTPGVLTADFQVVNAAGSNQVKIIDKSVNAATIRYDLGDGTSTRNMAVNGPALSYYYFTANTYTITQTATSAGGQTATKQVTVNVGGALQPLQAAFTVNTQTAQAGQTIIVGTDASTGSPVTWSWDFGDGFGASARNIRYIYTTAGSYTLSLTVTSGSQTSTISKTITVTAVPVTPVVETPYKPHNLPATVEAEDYDNGGEGVAYHDTTTGNAGGAYRTDNVDITKTSDGGYAVSTIESGEWLNYTIKSTETSDFYPFPVDFYVASTENGRSIQVEVDGIVVRNVSVPNTGSLSKFQPVFTQLKFSDASSHTIRLLFNGNGQSLDKMVFFDMKPTWYADTWGAIANFTPDKNNGISPLTVQFTDTSPAEQQYIQKWHWNFGDGTTSGEQNPTHTYLHPGVYSASLSIEEESHWFKFTHDGQAGLGWSMIWGGDSGKKSQTITVTGDSVITPVANFTVTPQGGAGSMGIQVIDASVNATSVLYDLGDGTTTTYSNFRYTYWQPGTYTIKQTATSATGSSIKTITVTVPATINPPVSPTVTVTLTPTVSPTGTGSVTLTPTPTDQPQTGAASFTVSPTSGKKSFTAALTDTTTGGTPVSWKWNCGNGQSFSGKSVGLNRIWYNNAGTYTITLTVTDQNGSTRTASKTVTVTS